VRRFFVTCCVALEFVCFWPGAEPAQGEGALGDFNGDGFADLAVDVPGEKVDGDDHAGAVNVLYGTAAGLSAAGNQFWHQNQSGISGAAEPFDEFGNSLAATSTVTGAPIWPRGSLRRAWGPWSVSARSMSSLAPPLGPPRSATSS
jgi:FG-GAP repeat